jgi:uncharacterized protein (DUF1330 family)
MRLRVCTTDRQNGGRRLDARANAAIPDTTNLEHPCAAGYEMKAQRERSTVGGDRHGGLRHWPTSISTPADGVEGAEPPLAVVILEFPSLEQAQGWHDDPDYVPLKQLRQANVDMEVFVVDSV